MIRAVRFATRLNFTIEPETAKAIERHASELLPAVAVERIWQEFQKMAGHPKMALFLAELHRFHLLEQVYPQLAQISDEQLAQRLAPLVHYPKETPTIAYLTALFELPTPEIALRLKASRAQLQFIDHQRELLRLLEEGTPQEFVHFYALDQAELLLQIHAAGLSDRQEFLDHHRAEQQRLATHIERVRTGKPLVTSQHLKEIGIQPGKEMGQLLRRAEKIAIEYNLDNADEVLSRLLDAHHD